MIVALVLVAAGCGREEKPAVQEPAAPTAVPGVQQPPASPAVKAGPLSEIESLVAPIALYPDPLLAELLVASTYPPEIVEAARWLASKPDPATLKAQGWDASVMRLTEVPSVVVMMSEHLSWTTRLGNTFLAVPDEVMDTIQALRRRAAESGFLKDTPEQQVTMERSETDAGTAMTAVLTEQTISIQPAKSDTIYVPQYNPETAYAAPLAPAPATAAYPASGYSYPAAVPSYYPMPVPATTTTTTTTSDSDELLTFGAGALVGGLLTWGIMEWADDDDWDGGGYYGGYYGGGYPVVHHYGNTVCRGGNCWSGGGGYYGGRGDINVDRGDVTRNRNVNISGNEVNVNRDGSFRQDQLANIRPQTTPWTHDVRHRRGEHYPESAQKRLGQVQQPALAGHRLGAAQALPAENRGFGRSGAPATKSRLSSEEVQGRLAQQPVAKGRQRAKAVAGKPSSTDVRKSLSQGSRSNAFQGLRSSSQQTRFESRRGSQSRQVARSEPQRRQTDRQRRPKAARPNAFEGSGNARRTQNYSQRGAESRQRVASAGRSQRTGGGAQRAAGSRQGGGGRRR
jgi:Protein of unknown function (DUF3300)